MLIWIIVAGVFSVLVLIHEAGHLIAAKKLGIRVETFSVGMGKRLFGVKRGETDYRVSMIPFGGFCQMAGENIAQSKGAEYEFSSKPVGRRFWVIAAGSITNYVFAFLLFWITFMIGSPMLSNEVGRILKGYPAEEAGIREDDKILFINGKKVEYWEDIVRAIKKESSKDETLDVTIARGEETLVFKIKPSVSDVKNIFGKTVSHPIIGIAPKNKILPVSYNPLRAAYYGAKQLLVFSWITYKGIWLILTGGISLKASVSGPIGIAYLLGQAADLGFVPLLAVTAHISMALAIFNLLPFPVLDGGGIVFLFFEKLRKKPVSMKVQEMAANAALIMLIAFALFVSWYDIIKFTPMGGAK